MKTSKILSMLLIGIMSIAVMTGCNDKDELSNNDNSNGNGYTDNGSGGSSDMYDIYKVECLKIVSTNFSSYDDAYAETRYIWVDKYSNKAILCRNSYSFDMIGNVKDNSYSEFKGYPVSKFKYHTNDPLISSNFDYFYNDGTYVQSGGSSSGGSGDNGSGSGGSITPSKCSVCNGSGKCQTCHGTGRIGTSSFGVKCSLCGGTGTCKYCGGSGY